MSRKRKYKTKCIKKTIPDINGEWFAIASTGKNNNLRGKINFWHFTPNHTYLYTFVSNESYHCKQKWTEDLYRKSEADLRSPNSNIKVLRFLIDDSVIFCETGYEDVPKIPKSRNYPEGWEIHLQRKEKELHRIEIEAKKSKEFAPFILYGKFNNESENEYFWKLNPDKAKRQGIVPGDRVVVWTKNGFKVVTVTRIEANDINKEQPTARVKKKLPPCRSI